MSGVNDIRTAFLDYFARHGHSVVSSSALVPHNDPTLLFTNAGMVQFKNVFTGAESRPYSRAVSSQKCVRAGGKHNDLDNVGYTARHHTFFEMLGNFSFGDYFKDQAIELAWNLITKEYGLDAKRLLVTVYHEDDDAAVLWKKVAGLSDDRIIRIPTDANYWRMGDTGPCGPCSEIFFDHGEGIPGGPPGSPDEDGDRFIEIWNLVFMQFEEMPNGDKVALPKPSIDTGMGLERLAAVLQGHHDNYDIDLMRNLIVASAEVSGADADGPHAVSHRVVADHLRSVSFLMADGVMPSNEGRGYVLRRIMRRAMRHAHLMGVADPLMWRLVPALIREMGQHYPELIRAQALITETLKLEESRFRTTLERGLRLLDEEVQGIAEGVPLPGDVAFRLYDTYGFPLDLTQDALRAQGRGVDVDGFNVAMEKQRADARAAWAGSGEQATDKVWFEIRERSGATEFLGYGTEVAEGQVAALVVEAAEIDAAHEGNDIAIVMNQTPFYGESGGQVGDTGIFFGANGVEIAISNTRKMLGALHVHIGTVVRGAVKNGDVLEMRVNADRRGALRANHSATHLLHAALRKVLGEHVTQKGSMVAPDRLRFDISHPKALSDEEVTSVEQLVNGEVRGNTSVETVLASPEEAVEHGALALFGEKYGDEVRVVAMGGSRDDGHRYSVELCGGTHATRTGDIGFFKIVSEGAVAAGVRRIEAVTGSGALAYVQEQDHAIREAAALIKASPAELGNRLAGLLEDRKRLERELSETRRAMASGGSQGAAEVRDVNGIKFAARSLEGVPAKELRGMADDAKKTLGSGVVAIATVADGKAALVVGVTADLLDRFSAVDLVQVGAAALGGKGGGGRPDMAQAGGPDGARLDDALAAIERALGGAA
ncbi:MAG: alanine--tRNA ligase [Proteobacteria bacterium]|nr:alanine--tRNA ligase [Pseudomonadota bacterium]MDA1059171.1 alanine--tRNA ligase [Pseudomonadota bacterium]